MWQIWLLSLAIPCTLQALELLQSSAETLSIRVCQSGHGVHAPGFEETTFFTGLNLPLCMSLTQHCLWKTFSLHFIKPDNHLLAA